MLEIIKPFNIILAIDVYKGYHWLQIPKTDAYNWGVIVPRKPSSYTDEIAIIGQTFIANILARTRVTMDMVDEAEIEITEQGGHFNRVGWTRVVKELNGVIPLAVYGVEEGRVVKPQTPVVGCINTHPEYAWLATHFEPWIQGTVWKMSTVATICRESAKILKKYMLLTGADMATLYTKHHNFGDRAAGSPDEAAVLAGIAHACVFETSDCQRANRYIKSMYRTSKPYTSSIEATEHSTMCANSKASTLDDWGAALMLVDRLEAAVERHRCGIGLPVVSGVVDTYDSTRFVQEYLGTRLHDRIANSGGTLIGRTDSGLITVEPGHIGRIFADKFGYHTNTSKYDVLAPCIGVLQGDGISIATEEDVLKGWVRSGFSIDGFALGMGHGTTNDCARDDFSWSMKAVAAQDHSGTWRRLFKCPKTDPGKASLSGLVRCRENEQGELEVYDALSLPEGPNGWMNPCAGWRLWYRDGYQEHDQSFDNVRERTRAGI